MAIVASLRDYLAGHLGSVASEVVTFKDKFSWSSTQAFAGGATVAGLTVTSSLTATGLLARAGLTAESKTYAVPITSLLSDAGASLLAAETAGTWNVNVASNVIRAQGEVTDNETEVSVCWAQFVLPPEYVAAGNLTLTLPVKLVKTAAATDNGSTIDALVYLASEDGTFAVGSDICATAAQTFAAVDTAYEKAFTITGTTLVPGSVINISISSSIIDNEAGGGTLRINMEAPKLTMSVKG
jgi:hypothetical protein